MQKKLILVKTVEAIPEIGGLTGPITTPMWVDVEKIFSMVKRGVKVVEVNSSNRSVQVELTKDNVYSDNFEVQYNIKKTVPVVETVEAPKVESETVANDNDVNTTTDTESTHEYSNRDRKNDFKKNKKKYDAPSTSDFSAN